jgi:hypothetical protein
VGPLPSANYKWHIGNALDAKITADVVHSGERGFHMNIAWLYISSLSRSYRDFTDFGGICSGIPRLDTVSSTSYDHKRDLQISKIQYNHQDFIRGKYFK